MDWLWMFTIITSVFLSLLSARIVYLLIFPYRSDFNQSKPLANRTCKVAAFLGSGGHTTEMLQLLSTLPSERYTPRVYIVSSGDQFSIAKAIRSEEKIHELSLQKELNNTITKEEKGKNSKQDFDFIHLPRARNVYQAWLSTPVTVLIAFAVCLQHITIPTIRYSFLFKSTNMHSSDKFADLILMNGPGTCVPIVASVWILRLFGLPSPRLIYVESFARVKSLSLTAKILRFFVDRFVVQWSEGIVRGAHYRGWLV